MRLHIVTWSRKYFSTEENTPEHGDEISKQTNTQASMKGCGARRFWAMLQPSLTTTTLATTRAARPHLDLRGPVVAGSSQHVATRERIELADLLGGVFGTLLRVCDRRASDFIDGTSRGLFGR